MSSIIALREAIMDQIRENIPEIAHVDWHDGAFDDDDVEEITTLTPAAYVTVFAVPNDEQLTTRQVNADVRVYVNIICSDNDSRTPRGSDPQVWALMEKLVLLANLNTWGVKDCAVANGVKFKRLRDPKLRREGIAVGCVEWSNGLKLGANAILEREFLPDPCTTLSQAGADFLGMTTVHRANGASATETNVELTLDPDDIQPHKHEIW